MTIDALRGFGERRVTVRTAYGAFEGSLMQSLLAPESVLVLLAQDGDAETALAIAVDDITEVAER